MHGDDFMAVGPKRHLDWYESSPESRYELMKGVRLGAGPNDQREATCLNRVIRWCDGGFEYEADPRQAENLITHAPGVEHLAAPNPLLLHAGIRGR